MWEWVTWEKERSFEIIVVVVIVRVAGAGFATGRIRGNEEGSTAAGHERWEVEQREVDGNGTQNKVGCIARK